MKVLLRTACGATQIMDVQKLSVVLYVPLKVKMGFEMPTDITEPRTLSRAFRILWDKLPIECGFEAIYDEVNP